MENSCLCKFEQLTENLAALVESTGNYRCLRRLELDDIPSIKEATSMDEIVAIVDTETTGLAPRRKPGSNYKAILGVAYGAGQLHQILTLMKGYEGER